MACGVRYAATIVLHGFVCGEPDMLLRGDHLGGVEPAAVGSLVDEVQGRKAGVVGAQVISEVHWRCAEESIWQEKCRGGQYAAYRLSYPPA